LNEYPCTWQEQHVGTWKQTTEMTVWFGAQLNQSITDYSYHIVTKIKLNICSVWHNYLFILLFFYYWLQLSVSKSHHQANI
jgi:hypothetical protein